MITAPEPEPQDRIEKMEQEMVKDLPELEFIAPEEQNFGAVKPNPNHKDTTEETSVADPEPEEQDEEDDESFYGMLKKVGII